MISEWKNWPCRSYHDVHIRQLSYSCLQGHFRQSRSEWYPRCCFSETHHHIHAYCDALRYNLDVADINITINLHHCQQKPVGIGGLQTSKMSVVLKLPPTLVHLRRDACKRPTTTPHPDKAARRPSKRRGRGEGRPRSCLPSVRSASRTPSAAAWRAGAGAEARLQQEHRSPVGRALAPPRGDAMKMDRRTRLLHLIHGRTVGGG